MSTPEHIEKQYQFSQKLMDISIAIIADAKVDVTALWGTSRVQSPCCERT
jgi:hypothetical protein